MKIVLKNITKAFGVKTVIQPTDLTIMRSSVVFPQPEGPSSVVRLPLWIVRSVGCITVFTPNAFVMFFKTIFISCSCVVITFIKILSYLRKNNISAVKPL